MKTVTALIALFVAASLLHAQPASASDDRRVLVISVDGLRPDLALLADCPNLRGLMRRGAYTMWAQTTDWGITLPSHTSMLTGRRIANHGVTWNGNDVPAGIEYQHPQCPTLFQLAKEAGYSTAIVAGKLKFRTLARPGTVDWLSLPEDSSRDDEVTADAAVALIGEYAPRVMLLHLARVDSAGHREGWGSPEQLAAVETADACIGRVLAALEQRGVLDETLIIVSADHGGFGKSHHGGDPRGLHIPWIAAGPGVRAGYDLTRERDLVVKTEDTFATACVFLGIELPKCEGVAVAAAFEEMR